MKSFIDRVFKSKQQKQKELLDEITHTEVTEATEKATKAVIKSIKVDESKEVYAKPGHYFPDCNCFKCVRWRNQGA
jgi:hypothetical protein